MLFQTSNQYRKFHHSSHAPQQKLNLAGSIAAPNGPGRSPNVVLETRELRDRVPCQAAGTGKMKVAVNDLTSSVRQGEVFGFLGPNGAGKTTTMNVLLGFFRPRAATRSFSA